MKLNIFSVFDEKAKTYNAPFYQPHIGQAERSFSDLVQDPKTTISRHPEDFHLYHIGVFDDDTASIESFPEPRLVCRATEFVNINV